MIIYNYLYEIFKEKKDIIQDWFEKNYNYQLLYNSVDIRNAGYKISVVDTNIFPAGFNNLSEAGFKNAKLAFAEYFKKNDLQINKVALLSEAHTTNLHYIDNIINLKNILDSLNIETYIINNDIAIDSEVKLTSAKNRECIIYPYHIDNNILKVGSDFIPDIIITNNDFTSLNTEALQEINQKIIPSINMGWFKRKKTHHFDTFNNICQRFCFAIDIDPWLISTIFSKCGVINFKEQKGIDCISRNIDKTINKISKKYQQYNIKDEPYVFIKSNMGTYGLGIMTAYSSQDITQLNKKIRKKMNVIKGGVINSEVIIQEGVKTIDQVNNIYAEHMVYSVGNNIVEHFFRLSDNSHPLNNLNHGKLSFITNNNEIQNYVNSILSKLSALSASWECYEVDYSI